MFQLKTHCYWDSWVHEEAMAVLMEYEVYFAHSCLCDMCLITFEAPARIIGIGHSQTCVLTPRDADVVKDNLNPFHALLLLQCDKQTEMLIYSRDLLKNI
jgi:hypothetical protein